jgi:hypothetical protein
MMRGILAETRILAMALFAWGPRRQRADEPSFTSGSILAPVLIAVAVLGVIEIAVVHLIVQHWSPAGAFVLTAIGVLVSVYMIGLAKSLQYMPTVLQPQTLLARLGHLLAVEAPYAAIKAVRKVGPGMPAPSKCLNIAAMSSPNLVIDLANDQKATGLFGRTREVRQIAVRMDDADSFEACLSGRLKSCPKKETPEEKPTARAAQEG